MFLVSFERLSLPYFIDVAQTAHVQNILKYLLSKYILCECISSVLKKMKKTEMFNDSRVGTASSFKRNVLSLPLSFCQQT